MSVFVPKWVLWALVALIGIPLAIAVVIFAVFGFVVAGSLKNGIWK